MKDADVLNEVVRLLGSIPEKAKFRHDIQSNHEWLGSLLFVLNQSTDRTLVAEARAIAASLPENPVVFRDPRSRLIVILQQLKREYEFKVGYSIPRNYIEIPENLLAPIEAAKQELETAVREDNELPNVEREIILTEIAILEAQLGVARLSSELIARFVNGILKGSAILAAGSILKQAASRLADLLLTAIGWP
ncbi:MAG: hypothetical protein RLO80_04485 [Hyphomonas sp.]